MASRSAWTERARGATTSSLSGCGAASNTRRCISEPTTACPRPARRSAAISTSIITAGLIRALTRRHPIKPTSTCCHSAWQPNPGRRSTYRRGKSVQTTGATSLHCIAIPCEKLIMLTLKPTGLGQPNDFEVLDQDLRREEQGYTRRCRLFLHMERERMCPLEN